MTRPAELRDLTDIRFSAPPGGTLADCERIALYFMYTLSFTEVRFTHNSRNYCMKLKMILEDEKSK